MSGAMKEKVKMFVYIYITIYVVYAVFMNHGVTSDHIGAFMHTHGKVLPVGIKDLISAVSAGRFASVITSYVGWLFYQVHVSIYQNQFVLKLLLIAFIAMAIVILEDLYKEFYQGRQSRRNKYWRDIS